MVRAEMIRRFGPAAYTAGLKVTTTIDSRLQAAANRAMRDTLMAYDERHGYRGPLAKVELPPGAAAEDPGAISAAADAEQLRRCSRTIPRSSTKKPPSLQADDVAAKLFRRLRRASHQSRRRIGPRRSSTTPWARGPRR
jgi:membrane carboxypeptidase/penicillin-binding protein